MKLIQSIKITSHPLPTDDSFNTNNQESLKSEVSNTIKKEGCSSSLLTYLRPCLAPCTLINTYQTTP